MVKPIFLYFGLLISSSIFSQEIKNNFAFDENHNIYWQHIFEGNISFEALVEAIESSGNFENIVIKQDYINCELKPYQIDYEKYGYKTMSTPFYISRSLALANAKFDYKEGRYRVTFYNILFKQNSDDTFSQQGEQHSFEWWVLNKKGSIKKGSFDPGSDIMNNDFLVKTTFSEAEDDW